MANYLVGDIQGCDAPLARLLATIAFSPSRDTLYVLGDLVNRGPASAAVLRRLMALGGAAQCLLGNHDLSLLALAYGYRASHPNDTLGPVVDAHDRDAMLDWLRHRPMALQAHGLLLVHAGVLPQWDVEQTLSLAGEVESALRDASFRTFLAEMYGNEPAQWSDTLAGPSRLRVVVNALTRLRFCTPDGVMHLKATGRPDQAPAGTLPWFDVPHRRTRDVRIAFGHWSTLGHLLRNDVIALDTGCVWGGCLSALKLDAAGDHTLIQVQCEQSQLPGE